MRGKGGAREGVGVRRGSEGTGGRVIGRRGSRGKEGGGRAGGREGSGK